MQITILRESEPGETRVAVIPDHVKKLTALGASVAVESGAGAASSATDEAYKAAGATISADRGALLASSDLLISVGRPEAADITKLKEGSSVLGFVKPFEKSEPLQLLVDRKLNGFAMEFIPRSTIAQKMDAISSQASLAGYAAVVLAADRLNRILPMMSTPAGTITPTKVFIIGAGVAGLQAIATARRMGAIVEAFDVRPEVGEQIKSLGAKPVKVDLGETGSTQQGYAKQLTEEQLQKQRDVMAKQCAGSDVVISTAQVFGRKSPIIVTTAMVDAMKPGSVVVDLAVESGGNIECSQLGEEIMRNGVRIVGLPQLARRVPVHGSQMYSSNVCSFIEHSWNKETNNLDFGRDDEIVKSCMITCGGEIRNETVKTKLSE